MTNNNNSNYIKKAKKKKENSFLFEPGKLYKPRHVLSLFVKPPAFVRSGLTDDIEEFGPDKILLYLEQSYSFREDSFRIFFLDQAGRVCWNGFASEGARHEYSIFFFEAAQHHHRT